MGPACSCHARGRLASGHVRAVATQVGGAVAPAAARLGHLAVLPYQEREGLRKRGRGAEGGSNIGVTGTPPHQEGRRERERKGEEDQAVPTPAPLCRYAGGRRPRAPRR
jgi:hypothetical protein